MKKLKQKYKISNYTQGHTFSAFLDESTNKTKATNNNSLEADNGEEGPTNQKHGAVSKTARPQLTFFQPIFFVGFFLRICSGTRIYETGSKWMRTGSWSRDRKSHVQSNRLILICLSRPTRFVIELRNILSSFLYASACREPDANFLSQGMLRHSWSWFKLFPPTSQLMFFVLHEPIHDPLCPYICIIIIMAIAYTYRLIRSEWSYQPLYTRPGITQSNQPSI